MFWFWIKIVNSFGWTPKGDLFPSEHNRKTLSMADRYNTCKGQSYKRCIYRYFNLAYNTSYSVYLPKGGSNPRFYNGSHGNSKVQPPKIRAVFDWVTFQALDFWCTSREKNIKTLNDHYWCTRLGVAWFLRGPKMANYKSGGPQRMKWQTRCNDWLARSYFTPLGITFECHYVNHFVCISMQGRVFWCSN